MVNIYLFLLWIYNILKTFHDRDFEFPILCDQAIPLCDKNKNKKLMSTFYDKTNTLYHFKC